MINRVITIVLDGFGVGEAPDAFLYKDEGSNTLKGIYNNTKLTIPNMNKIGLYNIEGIDLEEKVETIGAYGKAMEKSVGKNSPVGHWEICGHITLNGFTTYPNAFPEKLIEEFKKEANLDGILCNEVGSGTDIIKKFRQKFLVNNAFLRYNVIMW